MWHEIYTGPLNERAHLKLLYLENLVIITLLITIFLFLIQNVIMSKYLDCVSGHRDTYQLNAPDRPKRRHNNEVYLYPYALCLVFLYVLFLSRTSIKSSRVYSLNYQFELFRGLSITPRFIIDNTNIGFLLTTLTIGLAVNMI